MKSLTQDLEVQCPECGNSQFSLATIGHQASLVLATLVARFSKRFVKTRLQCQKCKRSFDHLHVLPRKVIGYHGCHREFAVDLVAGKVSVEEWKKSQNDYDWLGEGVYFWEDAPGRAWQWAREEHGPAAAAVVVTEVRLGRCLDLADTGFTDLLGQSYNDIVKVYEKEGLTLPTNKGKGFKLRKLDRLVIDTVTQATDKMGVPYQTVRCPFEEGDAVYAGGMIKAQSHIQLSVRDHACIASRVYQLPSEGGKR